MDKKLTVRLHIPPWAAVAYLLLSIILVPWTWYISLTLPTHHLSEHWDASWGGLDVGLVVALLATAWLARRQSVWVIIAASVTASFLLVDAWFDVMSSRGLQFEQALALAIFVEGPLAMLTLAFAIHTLVRLKR